MSRQNVLGLMTTICCCLVTVPVANCQNTDRVKQVEELLTTQAECWNQKDIEGFMQTYWRSDKLTFSSGGRTTRGWQATLDRYRRRYPPEKMGHLVFDNLETSLLSDSVALVLGQWHLDLAGKKSDGNFSLVVRKIDNSWKIVHDHSSTIVPTGE